MDITAANSSVLATAFWISAKQDKTRPISWIGTLMNTLPTLGCVAVFWGATPHEYYIFHYILYLASLVCVSILSYIHGVGNVANPKVYMLDTLLTLCYPSHSIYLIFFLPAVVILYCNLPIMVLFPKHSLPYAYNASSHVILISHQLSINSSQTAPGEDLVSFQ